jgi:hypothetical protein
MWCTNTTLILVVAAFTGSTSAHRYQSKNYLHASKEQVSGGFCSVLEIGFYEFSSTVPTVGCQCQYQHWSRRLDKVNVSNASIGVGRDTDQLGVHLWQTA